MATFKVTFTDCYEVQGIGYDESRYDLVIGEGLTKMLMYFYPDGDRDHPYDAEKMEACLYDLANMCDDLKDGDVFETPHGKFEVYGKGCAVRAL